MSQTEMKSKDLRRAERGSAMVLAIFVLVLLAGMSIALLFLTENEVKMSQADLRSKKAFSLAEAGLEDGRANLLIKNGQEVFTDDLGDSAGLNGVVDFDVDAIQTVYDAYGNVTGFTAYGDDNPINIHFCSVTSSVVCEDDADCPVGEVCGNASTVFGEGRYIAFLTNDPAEGETNTTDTNERVMLTGVAAGADRSLEVVQAIIEIRNVIPTIPPATVTLLGPTPSFASSRSKVKDYVGDDCGGAGVPGMYVPVIGTIGPAAELSAEQGIAKNPDYSSGSFIDEDTFADLTDPTEPTVVGSGYGPIDPAWTECQNVLAMVEDFRAVADNICTGLIVCDPTTPCPPCDPRGTGPGSITFIDGDYSVRGNLSGSGVLVVTGHLEFSGNTAWDGLILVFGEGSYRLNGGGNGEVSGGMMVADIAGPDGIYGTSDDCTGGDGGFAAAEFDENGGGNSGTIYCTQSLETAVSDVPYEIVSFLQR